MRCDGGLVQFKKQNGRALFTCLLVMGLWTTTVSGLETGQSLQRDETHQFEKSLAGNSLAKKTLAGNLLADAASPYLREAAGQPVHWRPWGQAAFDVAQAEHKPILLDIGAVWCHWCHVMDAESYENEEIAGIINQYFVAIKVDMDERPDIDRRYQEAVRALTGQGGWPLTAFLTPDGHVFFGGTYFPPDSRDGRVGLKDLLPQLSKVFQTKTSEVQEHAAQISQSLRHFGVSAIRSGPVSESLIQQVISKMVQEFDSANGGFGEGVKFPAGSPMELALARHFWNQDPRMLKMVTTTLDAMAHGGIYDHLGGGFFRYTTDPRWRVPHFEKMNYNNAELLINYLHAHQATGKALYRETAEGILRYLDGVLSDRVLGGFYAHQDADMTREDDGDYYTWTVEDVQRVLPKMEADVILRYFDIRPNGEMARNPAKNVLFVAATPDGIARELETSFERVRRLIRQGTARLLRARMARPAPLVDRTMYVDRNGLLISAYLEAYQVLGDETAKAFALKTLDRLLAQAYRKDQGMAHALFHGQARLFGLLNDQVHMANALLLAFEVTAERRYLTIARELMDFCLTHLWDSQSGGFFDRSPQGPALGALTRPVKDVDDTPFASPNGVAALVLDRLADVLNEPEYRQKAQETLEAYAGSVRVNGHVVAAYGLAAHYHLHRSVQAVIIGDVQDDSLRALWQAALRAYRPGKLVVVYDPTAINVESLPPAVAGAVKVFGVQGEPRAYICAGETCAPPTGDPEDVSRLVADYGKLHPEPFESSEPALVAPSP